MIALFPIQDIEQKELFFKLSNAFSLSESIDVGQKVSGIYAIFNKNTCLYVGMSTNLPSRIATHLRGKYSECTHIQIHIPQENGFADFYGRSDESKKQILINNEKALMAMLNPIDNLIIDMDFKLNEEEIFENLESANNEIKIVDVVGFGSHLYLRFDPNHEILETDELTNICCSLDVMDNENMANILWGARL